MLNGYLGQRPVRFGFVEEKPKNYANDYFSYVDNAEQALHTGNTNLALSNVIDALKIIGREQYPWWNR